MHRATLTILLGFFVCTSQPAFSEACPGKPASQWRGWATMVESVSDPAPDPARGICPGYKVPLEANALYMVDGVTSSPLGQQVSFAFWRPDLDIIRSAQVVLGGQGEGLTAMTVLAPDLHTTKEVCFYSEKKQCLAMAYAYQDSSICPETCYSGSWVCSKEAGGSYAVVTDDGAGDRDFNDTRVLIEKFDHAETICSLIKSGDCATVIGDQPQCGTSTIDTRTKPAGPRE